MGLMRTVISLDSAGALPLAGFAKSYRADKAGISKPYLSQIETGKRQGTLAE